MKMLLRLVCALIAAGLELAATIALFAPGYLTLPFSLVLAAHGGACVLALLAYLPSLPSRFRAERWIAVMLPLGFACALPVAGPVLAWLLVRYIAHVRPPADEQTEYYFGDNPYLTSSVAPAVSGAHSGRSLSELLQSTEVEVRRRAVLAVRNLTPRTALPLLRQAQQDSDEQVRIFARNFLARIVEHLESSLKLSGVETLDPSARLDHVIHVVDQYQEFVDLGLLSDGNRTSHLQQASTLLDRVRQSEPDNEKILCLLLKISVLQGDEEQARRHMLQLQEVSDNPNITLPWELQIRFQKCDWQGVTEVLDYLRTECYNDPQFRAIYDFWRLRTESSPLITLAGGTDPAPRLTS